MLPFAFLSCWQVKSGCWPCLHLPYASGAFTRTVFWWCMMMCMYVLCVFMFTCRHFNFEVCSCQGILCRNKVFVYIYIYKYVYMYVCTERDFDIGAKILFLRTAQIEENTQIYIYIYILMSIVFIYIYIYIYVFMYIYMYIHIKSCVRIHKDLPFFCIGSCRNMSSYILWCCMSLHVCMYLKTQIEQIIFGYLHFKLHIECFLSLSEIVLFRGCLARTGGL